MMVQRWQGEAAAMADPWKREKIETLALLTKVLAMELGQYQITVNAVAPGLIDVASPSLRTITQCSVSVSLALIS